MPTALLAGALAGLGVAMPVGAAAVLLVDASARHGIVRASVAGAGVATGDGLWAAVAVVAGTSLSRLLAPWVPALQWVAVTVLIGIAVQAVRGFPWSDPLLLRGTGPVATVAVPEGESATASYAAFLALTLVNPVTVIYFLTLIVGAAPSWNQPAPAAAFVTGAFLASLSWQLGLAVVGARRAGAISYRAHRRVLVLDCILVMGFVLYIAFDLFRQ